MDIQKLLTTKIENEIGYKEEQSVSEEIPIKDVTSEAVKFYLYDIGTLLEEDTENCIYTASINAGFLNFNRAVLAIKYEKNKLIIKAFAREGLINQKTAEKAINKLREKINGNYPPTSNNKKIIVLCVGVVLCTLFLGCGTWKCKSLQNATKKYNKEVAEYNNKVKKYNDTAKSISISNIEGLLDEVDKLPTVDEKMSSVIKSWISGNSTKKINKDISTIKDMEKNLADAQSVMDNIDNPSKEWVVEKVKRISHVKDVKAVTKDNDVTGILERENGGCKECIYFIYDTIENDQYKDKDDSITRGTDGGGAIEIFSNLKDAEERCAYLKEFDDTILESGSYALIGTMVVRTSYKLSYEQQYEFTDEIFKALTN